MLVPILLIAVFNATVLFCAGAVAYWLLQRFAESETPVPFAEGVLRRVQGVDEGIKGGGQDQQRQAGGLLVNGVKTEENARPSNSFGIPDANDEDDMPDGMPDSVAKVLRDIRGTNGKT